MDPMGYGHLEKIEILDADLLSQNELLLTNFKDISDRLEISYGWHYFLDFIWVALELGDIKEKVILDAGASTGLLQWWMANRGATVMSVDLEDRSHLNNKLGAWCSIRGLRESDYSASLRFNDLVPSHDITKWRYYPKKLKESFRKFKNTIIKTPGEVIIYNQNLKSMSDIEDNSIDLVVSISSLEHNSVSDIRLCIQELRRVLKKDGKMIITLSAAKDHDWFHNPSKGWCFIDETIRSLFSLEKSCPSNYNEYDNLLTKLKNSKKLQDLIPDMYFISGDNGLPWGVLNPQYQPVGIVAGNTKKN
jgi:SAM-dependent methyltransferase